MDLSLSSDISTGEPQFPKQYTNTALFSINMDVNLLKHVNLDETPLPASSYNELPHIDDMKDTASRHAKAHAQLLGPLTALLSNSRSI